ncbi:MAG: hypothetical protein DRG33_04605 [Deltaproteobacteria bacterium]|nr:MAG: hypothetical protein DRG33_04605 [Deltaproteobacteria bacterium]
MAKRLPDPIKRREILYGKDTPPEVLVEYGHLYLEEGRWNDAVEFFGRAKYREGLMQLKEIALREGDFFLLYQIGEFLGEEFPPEVWKELGHRAMEVGKYHFARKAFGQAADAEGLRMAQERIAEVEGRYEAKG